MVFYCQTSPFCVVPLENDGDDDDDGWAMAMAGLCLNFVASLIGSATVVVVVGLSYFRPGR